MNQTAELECEWCSRPAQGRVHAQWTIADFDYADVCVVHWKNAVRLFELRRVDDLPVQYLTTNWYD